MIRTSLLERRIFSLFIAIKVTTACDKRNEPQIAPLLLSFVDVAGRSGTKDTTKQPEGRECEKAAAAGKVSLYRGFPTFQMFANKLLCASS
jgi:hypothetical protein